MCSVSSSPWEFAGLCKTGHCPAGWNREEESCVINLIGLEETVAREECGKYRGDFSSATQDSFQCKGGANLTKQIVIDFMSTTISLEKIPM